MQTGKLTIPIFKKNQMSQLTEMITVTNHQATVENVADDWRWLIPLCGLISC
ncbi:hypothetical protein S7335_3245 [Synechococcus sp. PCC 7335]|nr:hypothetical protein S7335_3245 [Synechococcus sp. PCC 7335]